MNITLNGEAAVVEDDATVADLLAALAIDPQRRGIAVAVDAEVVPRSEWRTQSVRDGAAVEILSAVQGG